MKVVVVGLGKLGSVIAAAQAAIGHNVVGVDLNPAIVDQINSGRAPFLEPGLQELISQAGSRLRASQDLTESIKEASVTQVIVPTPSDEAGVFTNDFVLESLTVIGKALRISPSRHTVIICSTVMPGSCDGALKEALETASGKTVGSDIGLVYSPEFIALGSIVHNMKQPDLILIGESDPRAGDVAESLALSVSENAPEVQRMNLINAEIVKLAINTFVTTKISFANMLGEICERIPGGDVDVVTNAVGADSRIGTKYLKSALGYGGPCFPRDNVALTRFSESRGVDATIPRATDVINNRQASRIVDLVQGSIGTGETVAVLGIAYKPETPVCESSQGVELVNQLVAAGYIVTVHDPQATRETAPALHAGAELVSELDEAIPDASAVIIATAWPQYADLSLEALTDKFIIDPWSVLSGKIPSARLGTSSSKAAPNLNGTSLV